MNKPRMLSDIDLYDVYCAWRRGSGPFRCFVRSTNFVTLRHYEDFPLLTDEINVPMDAIYSLVTEKHRDAPVILVELPGTEVIGWALHLQNECAIKPIITFNNIMHINGLVGNREYISALLLSGEKLKPLESLRYAFILDYERFSDFDETSFRTHFNNQYELTDDDLPPVEMLKSLGFSEILCIQRFGVKEGTSSL